MWLQGCQEHRGVVPQAGKSSVIGSPRFVNWFLFSLEALPKRAASQRLLSIAETAEVYDREIGSRKHMKEVE